VNVLTITSTLFAVIALAQDPVAPVSPQDQATSQAQPDQASEPELAEPWEGTFAAGVEQILAHAGSEEWDEALILCDRLLVPDTYASWREGLDGGAGSLTQRVLSPVDGAMQSLGLERLTDEDRALVRYQRGLILVYKGDTAAGMDDLEQARSLAGEGHVRRAAVYAMGTLDLMLGEVLRQQIPEITGAAPAPPLPPATGQSEQAPDPLLLAREAYTQARTHFVERLRLDWRHADTRANVELVQRRLRELDEIEQQRQEQQPPDESQEDPPEQESGEGEPQGSEQEDPQQDPSAEQESEESDQPEDSQEPTDPEENEADPKNEEDAQGDESESEPQELQLTEEELERLLRILKNHEEQGDRLREALLRRRRVQVERDW